MAVLKYRKDGNWYVVGDSAADPNQENLVDTVHYVGDNVVLSLRRNPDGVTDTVYLSGEGATWDYGKDDIKPWESFVARITAIYIESGITSLGNYLFARHEAVKTLTFEDSSKITHLGNRVFHRCQFGGEYSFPGLLDTTLVNTFGSCVNLRGITVPDTVTAIDSSAFILCLNLRRVSGLRNVKTVGASAFHYTPNLTSIDLNPDVCTDIGEAAFCISPALSRINAQAWGGTTFGYNATAASNWTEDELAEVRAVRLPDVLLDGHIADANHKYTSGDEYKYCTFTSIPPGSDPIIVQKYLVLGCEACALGTVSNVLHGTKYSNVGEWWIKEVYTTDKTIGSTGEDKIIDKVAATVGLKLKSAYPVWANAESGAAKFNLPAVKTAIAQELAAGNPLIMSLFTTSSYGHAVCIVGAESSMDKLIIVDTARSSGDRGMIYKVALEDIIGVAATAHIDAYEMG